MTAPLILLPPSEGKRPGGAGAPWRTTATATGPLAASRIAVVDALVAALRAPGADPRGVLRYDSDAVLERAVATDLAVDVAPTLPAVERYAGVVLDGLDPARLPADARDRMHATVRFVSGLWGLVAADEPIPDYRVKIGAKVPGLGVLGTWWRERVGPLLDGLAADRLVWDLLTVEHGRVWPARPAAARIATVAFTTASRGPRGVSNHHGKHLKGRFVAHLLRTDPTDVEVAATFTADDWALDRSESRLDGDRPRLVFVAAGR